MRFVPVLLVGCCLLGCPGEPAAGDSCEGTQALCHGAVGALVCIGGVWNQVPCDGPTGCLDTGAIACDNSVASMGTLCPPWRDGAQACQTQPAALLLCNQGVWQPLKSCLRCAALGGVPSCDTGAGGGAGGAGGGAGGGGPCGPSNCAGCCNTTGQCLTGGQNQTADFCGTAGAACQNCRSSGQVCSAAFACQAAAGCNAGTCASGCCRAGACQAGTANTACGKSAATCSDCTAFGLSCNASTRVCSSGAGGGGGVTDACGGVPTTGQCLSASVVQFCSIPTGSGTATVQTYQCPSGTGCQAAGGGASCVTTGQCTGTQTRCSSATQLQQCSSGAWAAAQTCASGCKDSPAGSYCGAGGATTTLTGTLRYETKNPQANYAGWGAVAPEPAVGVLVISTTGTAGDWLDTAVTDATGHYSLSVPASPTANDRVVFMAVGGDGLDLTYAVGDPNLGAGSFSPGQQGSAPRYWSWSSAVSSMANGGTTTLTLAQGGGALIVYTMLHQVYARARNLHHGRAGDSIIMWYGLNTDWSCGACFMASPSSGFDAQIWLGGSGNQVYSKAVSAHELGHWLMSSYGTSPHEGGPHTLGIPTMPGQAWSEGWATFHSASARNNPVYYDDQGGFFWVDTANRTMDGQYFIPGSTAAGGLLQRMEENEVASILWDLSTSSATATQEIHNALASPHMNAAPWPRGYTRHTWSVDSQGSLVNVVDTGEASLVLADLLDALRCSGLPGAAVTAATVQLQTGYNFYSYPYPSSSPSCRGGYCYTCQSGATCVAAANSTSCGTAGVGCITCGALTCNQGVCQ